MNEIEHLLVCLIEECAEVQHATAKALRFGLNDCHPKRDNIPSHVLISHECIDLIAIIKLLEERGAIKVESNNNEKILEKQERVLNRERRLGALDGDTQ